MLLAIRVFVLITVILTGKIFAQFERCPPLEQQDIDYEKFSGIWYEKLISHPYPNEIAKCSVIHFMYPPENGYINYTQSVVYPSNNQQDVLSVLLKYEKPGKFKMNGVLLNILSTDYDKFAVVYDCQSKNQSHLTAYSRDPTYEPKEEAMEQIERFQLPVLALETVSQVDCPPPNVYEDSFEGHWFEVAQSRPSEDNIKTCTWWEYVYPDDEGHATIRVKKEILRPNTTSNMEYNATYLSPGRIMDFNERIHILATDYKNFAVIHACRDDDSEAEMYRLFSRERFLTTDHMNEATRFVQSFIDLKNLCDIPFSSRSIRFPWLILISAGIVTSQSDNGRCPDVSIQPNFNAQKFSGRWFEMAQSQPFEDEYQRCISLEYIPPDENDQVTVHLRKESIFLNDTENIDFQVTDLSPGRGVDANGYGYRALGTDYDHYAVLHVCKDFTPGSEGFRIFSRKPTISKPFLKMALRTIRKNNLPVEDLIKADQKGCSPKKS